MAAFMLDTAREMVLAASFARREQEKGDIKALKGLLESWYRLRGGTYRIVFRYHLTRSSRVIRCDWAEQRSSVCQTLLQLLCGDSGSSVRSMRAGPRCLTFVCQFSGFVLA